MLVCSCGCPCVVRFVLPNCTAHGNRSLRVRSIFYLGHFWVMADHATEPFVLHAWLLRKSQLKFGKIIDNHIAGKKCQRTTSICWKLWTTKETYQKLLWYRFYTTLLFRYANPFWIEGFVKISFFLQILVIAPWIFFLIKIEYPLYWYHSNGFYIWENDKGVHILYLCY
jgi:hypothetical protein